MESDVLLRIGLAAIGVAAAGDTWRTFHRFRNGSESRGRLFGAAFTVVIGTILLIDPPPVGPVLSWIACGFGILTLVASAVIQFRAPARSNHP
jgi:hypothetical protein